MQSSASEHNFLFIPTLKPKTKQDKNIVGTAKTPTNQALSLFRSKIKSLKTLPRPKKVIKPLHSSKCFITHSHLGISPQKPFINIHKKVKKAQKKREIKVENSQNDEIICISKPATIQIPFRVPNKRKIYSSQSARTCKDIDFTPCKITRNYIFSSMNIRKRQNELHVQIPLHKLIEHSNESQISSLSSSLLTRLPKYVK